MRLPHFLRRVHFLLSADEITGLHRLHTTAPTARYAQPLPKPKPGCEGHKRPVTIAHDGYSYSGHDWSNLELGEYIHTAVADLIAQRAPQTAP